MSGYILVKTKEVEGRTECYATSIKIKTVTHEYFHYQLFG